MTDQTPNPDPFEALFESQQNSVPSRHPKFSEIAGAIIAWNNLWREFDSVSDDYRCNQRGSVERFIKFLREVTKQYEAFPTSEVKDRKSFEKDLGECKAALLSLIDVAKSGDSKTLRSKLNRKKRPDLREAESLQHALVNTILYSDAKVTVREPVSGYTDPLMEERDEWIYETRKSGATNPEVIEQLRRIFEEKNWCCVGSERGIRDAITRYQLKTGAPPLPENKGGRPRNTRN